MEKRGKIRRPIRLAVDMDDIDNILLAKYAPELAQGYIDQAEQIERLQAALRKADKWGDILSDLYEDEFITEEDMQ